VLCLSHVPSQSISQLASRRGLHNVCCAFPQSESQPHSITNKSNRPPTTAGFPSNKNLRDLSEKIWRPRQRHQKGKQQKGNAILGQFLKKGQKPSTKIFRPILQGLCSENMTGGVATILLDKMPKLGCEPDLVLYNILVKGVCSNSKTGSALQLLFKMVKHGCRCEPNVITYSIVIDGLCKEGELAKAFNLYKQMHSAMVIPNVVTYSSLINDFCEKCAIDKAEELLHAMISKGCEPSLIL
jgi:pentatricopeptide repeat protein